jgi:predicted DCC family thiol-disulfide oxidoreductase YuxK
LILPLSGCGANVSNLPRLSIPLKVHVPDAPRDTIGAMTVFALTDRAGEQPRVGWILYDGECGVCSRTVHTGRKLFEHAGLGSAPLQAAWVQNLLKDPPEDFLRDIVLLFGDGRRIRGAEVYRYVLRRTWWTYPIYAASVVPGLRWVFDRAYRWFARNRLRVSAVCHIGPIEAGETARERAG